MEEAPRSNLRPSSSRRLFWLVPLVALAGAGGWLFVRHGTGGAPEASAAAEPTPAAPPAAPSPPVPAVTPATAAEARGLLEGAAPDPSFHRWLAAGDVVKRWAAITADVAEGASPRRLLGAFAPHRPFTVEQQGDRLVIAAAAYARYDGVASAIGAVDAKLAATAYRRLHGVLEAAYHALGYPSGSLDRATARALHRLANAPVPAEAPAVERGEGGFVFADPALEQRTEVEKQLLRMGPHNAGLVQAKARELLEALELPKVAGR